MHATCKLCRDLPFLCSIAIKVGISVAQLKSPSSRLRGADDINGRVLPGLHSRTTCIQAFRIVMQGAGSIAAASMSSIPVGKVGAMDASIASSTVVMLGLSRVSVRSHEGSTVTDGLASQLSSWTIDAHAPLKIAETAVLVPCAGHHNGISKGKGPRPWALQKEQQMSIQGIVSVYLGCTCFLQRECNHERAGQPSNTIMNSEQAQASIEAAGHGSRCSWQHAKFHGSMAFISHAVSDSGNNGQLMYMSFDALLGSRKGAVA